MDPNTAMEAAAEGAKALTKFQEILQKVFNPKWTRAQTDADMDANERKIQMIRANPDMDIVFVGDEMHVRRATAEELTVRAQQRMLAEAIRQEDNIEKVLEVTVKELSSAEAVSEESVDDDWVARFFNIVKDVSNEDMQYVWGRILAGEISNPNSFSLRTLETIRNLSRQEAVLFQNVLPLVVRFSQEWFVTSDPRILKKYGVNYSQILLLDECGLISSDAMVSIKVQISDREPAALFNKKRTIIAEGVSSDQVEISVGVFGLTRVGIELAKVLEYEENDDYFVDIAKAIFENKEHDVAVSIHELEWVSETQIKYSNQVICRFTPEDSCTA